MKLLLLISTLGLSTVSATNISLSPSGGGTYPRLAHLADGSVLGGFTSFRIGAQYLTAVRSTDGGRTWSAWGVISTGTSDINDLDNIALIQLANGDVISTFRNHDKTTARVYTWYRITACISHDSGKTWAFFSQVGDRAANGGNGLWEPFMWISKSGALQVCYASENASNDQDILMRSSTNGGPRQQSTTGRDGMPACTDFTTASGAARVLCVFETTEGTGLFTVKSVLSSDDVGAPYVVTNTSGTLAFSVTTDEDTSAHAWSALFPSQASDPPAWGQKTTVLGTGTVWPSLYSRLDGSNIVLGCGDLDGVKFDNSLSRYLRLDTA
ncbi:glycoside hydrolase family 93 protein [Mycena belliarum]|uniref:Glycoside hydrolase family 93 protein n=1 Tax=Mycena belliarum TaxID=1033014 RepID=A0AAD6XSF9_9AGAR|nr:glycoside hydrolase family 93 protein [Mycena belliae]